MIKLCHSDLEFFRACVSIKSPTQYHMETLPTDVLIDIFTVLEYDERLKEIEPQLAKRIQLSFVKLVSKQLHSTVHEYYKRNPPTIFLQAHLLYILQYLAKNGYLSCLIEMQHRFNYYPDPGMMIAVCQKAAVKGHIHVLRHFAPTVNLKYAAEHAFKNGSLELVKFIHAQCGSDLIYDLNLRENPISLPLAIKGHIHVLEYLLANGFRPYSRLAAMAAEAKQLDVLKLLHQHDCPWSYNIAENAARGGSIECLKYAIDGGCEWDRQVTKAAAEEGHLHVLQYAIEQGCPISSEACAGAAHLNSVPCLQYLHEHGAEWGNQFFPVLTCFTAARYGHLEALKYAHEHGAPWADIVCDAAVDGNHTHILQYLHENNCPCAHRV